MGQLLLEDRKRYGGQYVAKRSFKQRRIISAGKNPSRVYADAKKKGVKDPVIFYVPKENFISIYQCASAIIL